MLQPPQGGQVGIVEVDYTQGQLHLYSTRAPAHSVWNMIYKTGQMVLGGWGSVDL